MQYLIVVFLVLLSALFSGLTLGFFSLNKDDLERKAKLGDKLAKKVYKIRKNGNLLLCTLLIGNVAVNTTLSIFLGSIASGFMAGIVATVLIVIFGEIIPQAAFSRYALVLGSKLVWLVRVFRFILYPFCAPIAWILDKALGAEIPTVYSKRELVKIIEEHGNSKNSDVNPDEEKIIKGALSYSSKKVKDILTPRTEMHALKNDLVLTKEKVEAIRDSGHSRIPVYKKKIDNIIGILYVKDLIANNWKKIKVEELCDKDVIHVSDDKPLDELLDAFKKTRHHLFVVTTKYGGVSGIVTIEDVLEEILGSEIVDEDDLYEDLQKRAIDKAKKKKIKRA